MSSTEGKIYVDPDGLKKAGEHYGDHAATYAGQLAGLQVLRSSYQGCWGDDEMGKQFEQTFVAGLDNAEAVLKGSHARVRYVAESLQHGSDGYTEADDDARDAGERLLLSTQSEPPARPGTRAEPAPADGDRSVAAVFTGLGQGIDIGKPAVPVSGGEPVPSHDGPVQPPAVTAEPRRSSPPTSDEVPEVAGARVHGRPVAKGHRVVALTADPDGTVTYDANRYDSVMPLPGSAVTSHGEPVPGDLQFFVVRDNPHADPTAPGYRSVPVAVAAPRR
jgi:hypothetical protein